MSSLRIGVGKGRGLEQICDLLRAGQFEIPSAFCQGRQLVVNDEPRRTVLVLARHRDMPQLLQAGHIDVALASNSWFLNAANPQLCCMHDLEIGQCRLSLLSREDNRDDPIASVCTRFTNLARKHLPGATVIPLTGCNEIALSLGFSDAVLDVVETGATIKKMRLVERARVLEFRHSVWTRIDRQHLFARLAAQAPLLAPPELVGAGVS